MSYNTGGGNDQPHWFYSSKAWFSSDLHNVVKKFPNPPTKRQSTKEFKFILGIKSLGYPDIYRLTHLLVGLGDIKTW